jgi:uncharacterized protein (TIGR00369 family)
MNAAGAPAGRFEAPDPHFERRVRESFACQAFMATLGAELARVEPGLCAIRVAKHPGLGQQHGYFHAGVMATIADSAAGYAAYTLMPAESSVLSIEFKINLLRPADGEAIVATARVVRPGRTVTVCTADVHGFTGGEERLCATAQLTMMRVEARGPHAG